ncbi:hypothetical protein Tco_0580986 [Tanacetum coccineum]
MDTKLLSAPESNNTLARCWFRRNVPVTTFGSWLLPVAGPLFLQFLGKASSIPTIFSWGDSISPDGLLPSIMLLLVIIVVVAIGVTVILVVVIIVRSSFKPADEANSAFRTFEIERLAAHKLFVATFSCYMGSTLSGVPIENQGDDRQRARSKGAKSPHGRKKSWGSNIGDGVALYACMTFIYGSSWKGEMASEAKRYLVKSFEESEGVFPGEAGK